MSSVYSRASGVLRWLGNDEKQQAAIAFQEIRRCVDVYDLYLGHSPTLSDEDVERLDADAWHAIGGFCTNQWFSRIWTQQEYVLNTEGCFHWGSSSIPLLYVRDFIIWIGLNKAAVWPKRLKHWPDEASTSNAISMTFKFADTENGTSDFLHVLFFGTDLLATDPQDYIYGSLGHPAAYDPQHGLIVTPDYSKTIDEVYMGTTISLLHSPVYGLRTLSYVHHVPATLASKTPSWIIRWHHDSSLLMVQDNNAGTGYHD